MGLGLFLAGCGTGGPGAPGGGTGGDGGNVLLNDALSYQGSLSGKTTEVRTTRESLESAEATQEAPLQFDVENTCVRVKDLVGGDLLDANGNVIGEIPLNPDGSFSLAGLPVGVDFTVCIDIGKDGTCELESCVNIPADDGGEVGDLGGVQVDPLTTMVLAKLRKLIEERGIDPRDLPISPVAVVARIVNAYTHLFEESGIEQEISFDDIEAVARTELARLFDEFLPAGARTGMQIVEGNLDAAVAADAEALAMSAAKVFLRAGFPIADGPGELDLSSLAELDGVTVVKGADLFDPPDSPDGTGEPGDGPLDLPEGDLNALLEDFPGELPFDPGDYPDGVPEDVLADLPPDVLQNLQEFSDELFGNLLDQLPDELLDGLVFEPAGVSIAEFGPPPDMTFYITDVWEPDRNFAAAESEKEGEDDVLPPSPVLNDHLLLRMAALQLEGRVISLSDLHRLLTDLDEGLGARLTYFIHDPTYFGPPLDVFETADGKGLAISLGRLFDRLFEEGFGDLVAEAFEQRERELRQFLSELLGDTLAPTFERLFAGFVRDRVESIDVLAQAIREARAHLPFNSTGASTFYVVADGDPFRTDQVVSAVTVNAEVTPDGDVLSINYDPTGNGKFYLGFTGGTEERGRVELLIRETGRFLHGRRGPVRVSLYNSELFAPVNGQPFADFVSETGVFYPGVPVTVISGEFRPEPVSPETTGREAPGPNQQIFVLATGPGPDAEPVRVDYDPATGVATYNPGGRNLLMFLPESQEAGEFALFNEDTGRPAGQDDPTNFFGPPPERPDDFEDQFNDRPPDGEFPPPPDGEFPPPPDGEFPPPPDGEFPPPPPDGEFPPPPDGEQPPPPDGEQPPPPPPDNEVPPAEDDGMTGDPPPEGTPPNPDEVIGEPPPGDVGDVPPPPDGGVRPEPPLGGGFGAPEFIRVLASEVVGIELRAERFTHVFGTEVPNERYNPDNDPYFDDVNGNGLHDAGEPTAPFRPTLFNPDDWRSTDIRLYYRRADNGQSVTFEEVAFDRETPQTFDGVGLVARSFLPRPNAYRFGRPNTAINLLTAFVPPEFFDGTHSLNADTQVDIFSAVAIINLAMDQVFNVEADVDIDGRGPLPTTRMLTDAHLFVVPIGDPFQLLLEGFRQRSVVADDFVAP